MVEFVICRTSAWGEKPCEEAYEKKLTHMNICTIKTLEEAKKSFWYKGWSNNGINHRVEDGCVVCDAKEKRTEWVIDIVDMDALLSFQKKYGEIVIGNDARYKEIKMEIEIYDDYRE